MPSPSPGFSFSNRRLLSQETPRLRQRSPASSKAPPEARPAAPHPRSWPGPSATLGPLSLRPRCPLLVARDHCKDSACPAQPSGLLGSRPLRKVSSSKHGWECKQENSLNPSQTFRRPPRAPAHSHVKAGGLGVLPRDLHEPSQRSHLPPDRESRTSIRLPCLSAKKRVSLVGVSLLSCWGWDKATEEQMGDREGKQRLDGKPLGGPWRPSRSPFPLSSPIPRAPEGQPSPEPTSTPSSHPLLRRTHDGGGWREVTTARPQPVTSLSQVQTVHVQTVSFGPEWNRRGAGSPAMGVGTAPQEETELKALKGRKGVGHVTVNPQAGAYVPAHPPSTWASAVWHSLQAL